MVLAPTFAIVLQITPENARRLTAQWTFQTETMARGRGYEATPLVLDDVLYATGPNNFAWAQVSF